MFKSLLKSFAYAILLVLFPVVSSIVIQIREINNDTTAYLVQAVFFGISALIGLLIFKNQKKKQATKAAIIKIDARKMLWFAPIIIIELIVFTTGIDFSQKISAYVTLFFFTVFVGISEEVFFRGIILNELKTKRIQSAIIISSLLFAVLHLANLAGGINIKYAILQVLFAFIFGVVAAQMTILTKSLTPAIIWHFSHDFIAFMTGNKLDTSTLIILAIQCVVLVIYGLYLNIHIKEN